MLSIFISALRWLRLAVSIWRLRVSNSLHGALKIGLAVLSVLFLVAPTSASETITYTYDALGRLVQVSHGGPVSQGASATYQYDKADNRSNVTAVTAWTSPAIRAGDFNGDGRADILWRDETAFGASYPAGELTDWLSNSSGGWTDNWSNAATGAANTTWHVVAVADFNGDGRADILWRNDSGYVTEWLGNANGSFTDNSSIAGNGSANNTWHIVGVGDFNGDGRADILWRNDDGTITDWLGTSTGSFTDNSPVAATGAANNTWHVVGVGDFNGDGHADILWRNDNGTFTEWLANANGSFSTTAVNSFTVDATWHVVGIGDFNCDRHADILWRNENGDLTEWQASSAGTGAFVSASMPYYSVATNVRVAAIGDFNGDHCDDLLWRDTAGNISLWYGSATGAFTGSSSANAYISTNWNVEPR